LQLVLGHAWYRGLDWPTAGSGRIAAGFFGFTSGNEYGNRNSWSQIEWLIEVMVGRFSLRDRRIIGKPITF